MRRYLGLLLLALVATGVLVLALTSGGGAGHKSQLQKLLQPTAKCPNGALYRPCGPHARGFAVPPKSGKLSVLPPVRGVATQEMYDSIVVSTVPQSPWAVAGYVGGSWPTYDPLVRAFPSARHLSIAVNSGEVADCLDDEPGDATPSQAGPWVRWMQSLHHRLICVYGSLSNLPAIRTSVRAAVGLVAAAHVLWWCAWYRYFRGLVPGCNAVQWTDHALNRNLDQSTVEASFFGPPPVDPYAKYPRAVRFFKVRGGVVHASEYNTVRTFDQGNCAHARGAVCHSTRDHLSLLLGRIEFLAYHVPTAHGWRLVLRPRWSSDQLGSRAAGIRTRLG